MVLLQTIVGGPLSLLRYLCLFVGGPLSLLRYSCLFVGGPLSLLRHLCLFVGGYFLYYVICVCNKDNDPPTNKHK
jgi:hypothetical protein